MLYLACHFFRSKSNGINAQRQWSKLPTSRLVESHSSLLCDNLPQRNLCSWKHNRCASKNWFPGIFSRLICTFSQQKGVDRCFFNSFFTSFTCTVRWLKLQPVYLERIFFASTRGPVVSTGSAVIRNGWSLAWKGSQSAKNSSPYFAQKIMTERSLQTIDFGITSHWSRCIDWLLSWSITSRRKWVRSNQIIVSRVQHPWFDSKMFRKLWLPSSRINVNKKSLRHQNCQPHIRCSEASKSSTLITTSWQDLGDFNVAQIPCGSWGKYDLPISSRPLSYCLVSLGIPPSEHKWT